MKRQIFQITSPLPTHTHTHHDNRGARVVCAGVIELFPLAKSDDCAPPSWDKEGKSKQLSFSYHRNRWSVMMRVEWRIRFWRNAREKKIKFTFIILHEHFALVFLCWHCQATLLNFFFLVVSSKFISHYELGRWAKRRGNTMRWNIILDFFL